jgi:hypothetical protein
MFEEDQSGDLLLGPTSRHSFDPDDPGGAGSASAGVEIGGFIIELVPAPAEDPETKAQVKTLREMLYASEPWSRLTPGVDPPPGMPQLLEKRINRVLGVVADWMLAIVEESRDDDEILVVLLELAEKVRRQIEWPERDAHAAGWHERNTPRGGNLAREIEELVR